MDMRGGTVNKMTFYCNNKSGGWGSARFKIYVSEVPNSVFTDHSFSNWDWDSMSEVFTGSGSLYVSSDHTMEIVLDSAFTYYGGNLKIGFKEIQLGSKISNLLWKGVKYNNTNVAVIYRCDSFGWMYDDFAYILPKITFDYYVLDFPMVEVSQGDITPNTASFSWVVPSSDVTGYKYQYNKASESFADNWMELPPTATEVTLENLDPSTNYVFRLKACYGVHESTVTVMDFKTTCPDYASIPYYENFDSYEVPDEWIPNVRMLPDCWDYINTSTNPDDCVYPSMHHRSSLSQYEYSAPNSLEFYIDRHMPYYEPKPQYVILPAMHNINRLRVKLYARLYSSFYTFSSKLKIGVMEGSETDPVFVPIQEISPTVFYQPFTIDLNSYEGDGEHIAIWMEVPIFEYGCVFIDDLEVEELPQFTMPIVSYDGNLGGWYLISSPLADTVNPTEVTHLINSNVDSPDFDLFRFNPNPVNPGMVWENWKQVGDHYHFDLEPGRGYLYANMNNVSLNFVGAPYEGDGKVTLAYNEEERFGGWNLVGNPFPVSAYLGDRAYYRVNDMGTGLVPANTGAPIAAIEGVFVYTETDGEVLTFTTTPPDRNNEQLSVNVSKITRSGLTAVIDGAILRFSEGDDLPKFQLNEGSTRVYIPQNGRDYAVITTEGQGEMPLNFSADENGTYTLSFNCENVEFSYLHLFDNKTGMDVDLLSTPSYTFNATTTDYESRFKLVFATGSSVEGDRFSFINSNGSFSIFGIEGEATLQVLDVMGRVLSTETFSNSIEKRLNVAPGVYFIRLVNGQDVKTQKIVVR